MTKRMDVLAVVILFVVSGVVISTAAKAQSSGTMHTPATAQATANSPGPKKAEEQFKNIQVLKGVPAEQIFPTMQFISASLGVECDFCHVQGAFEKDDKKNKQTARKMIEMMFAINQDNFEGHRAVTCNSCHRGNAEPLAIPTVMTEEPKEPMVGPKPVEGKQSAGPPPDQLLEKYVQAVGGVAAIDKVTSRVMKGSIDFAGKS